MAEATENTQLSGPSMETESRGLGTLHKLPLEIRSMIWQHCLPEVNILGKRRSLQCHGTYNLQTYDLETPDDDRRHKSCGPLLRLNSFLHHEISTQLHRTLTICFNPADHPPLTTECDAPIDIFIPTAGTCNQTDPQTLNFSKFQSLDLWVQIPHTADDGGRGLGCHPSQDLILTLLDFAQLIQSRQLRSSSSEQGSPWRPKKIRVVVDRDESRAYRSMPTFLYQVLCVLACLLPIFNVEDVKIECRIDLWLGSEEDYLPELLRRVEECMRRPEAQLEGDRDEFIDRFLEDLSAWRERDGSDTNGGLDINYEDFRRGES
ncbi:MAG: hypothetical protein Q9208_004056 [Pyrenodesmia sp. 3 TL-2023]